MDQFRAGLMADDTRTRDWRLIRYGGRWGGQPVSLVFVDQLLATVARLRYGVNPSAWWP